MEDVIVRSRYPRHNLPGRRKRKNTRDTNTFTENIMRQVVISMIILLVVGIVKSADTQVTNFLSDKIKAVVFQDIEINAVYNGIGQVLGKFFPSNASEVKDSTDITNEQMTKSAEDAFEEEAVPAGAGVVNLEQTESRDDEGGYLEGDGQQMDESSSEQENAAASQSLARGDSKESASSTSTESSNLQEMAAGQYSFITPVNGSLGSSYGKRVDPFTQEEKFHGGIDIEANNGDSIKAVLEGEIIEAGTEATLGNFIKMKHNDGFETVYAHCSRLLVKKGQKMKQGTIIARVGDTGRSIGAHLHFEVWKDGKSEDPLKYIKIAS